MNKQCRKCDQEKPETEFYKGWARCKKCACKKRAAYLERNREAVNAKKREHYSKNKEALKAKTRQWRIDHPDRKRETSRKYHINNREKIKIRDVRWRYGIEPEVYADVIARQNGRCAICGAANSGKRGLHIDHCHRTGKFRGLLCGNCNSAIGQFKEDPQLLMRAIAYLAEHNAKEAS